MSKKFFSVFLLLLLCVYESANAQWHHRRRSRESFSSEEEEGFFRGPPPPPPPPPRHGRGHHRGHRPPPFENEFGFFEGVGFRDRDETFRDPDQTFESTNLLTPQRGDRNNRKQRICEKKYTEYIRSIFPGEEDTAQDASDSNFDGRVLALPGEYPHMAALGFDAENDAIDYKCGGSLISENFVITAAHCTNFTGEAPSKVRIGDLNLKVEERFLEPQMRNVKRIHRHPQYKSTSYYNDIALLELDEEVNFTEFVRPIRLWVHEVMPYSIAYAMGYGATAFGKERTDRLTDLNMTIVPNSECNGLMPAMPETANGIIDSQICAQDYKQNRDTCQGDSGGPLQLNLPGRRRRSRKHYHLIGVTSYGLICRSGYPSVYTRVYSFLDWIEGIVWRGEF